MPRPSSMSHSHDENCSHSLEGPPGQPPPSSGIKGAMASGIKGVMAWPFLAVIRFYRRFISPLKPPVCRYFPSCSAYAQTAIILHGPVRGSWLAGTRILRCSPLYAGGLDPVPESEDEKRMLDEGKELVETRERKGRLQRD